MGPGKNLEPVASKPDCYVIPDVTSKSTSDQLKLCGAKGIRTPDLLDANENNWAFITVDRVGNPNY